MINPNNDADLATLDATNTANHIARLRRKGICAHGWRQGAGSPDNLDGESTCLDCGKVATWGELEEERAELL